MAAVSDGVPDMVSGDDQPIDLSRTPRKHLRVMPPLIPIKLLRAGYAAQQTGRQIKANEITLASLIRGKTDILSSKDEGSKCVESVASGGGDATDADDEGGDEDDDDDGCASEEAAATAAGGRKRVRLENGVEAPRPSAPWARLDRARSVPQLTPLPPLTPLPLALQRGKSLSESRIAGAAAAAAAARLRGGGEAAGSARPSAPTSPLLLRTPMRPSPPPLDDALRLQLQAAALRAGVGAGAGPGPVAGDAQDGGGASDDGEGGSALHNSWIYVGYYSQLLHRFQAQELLRQLALQHQHDANPAQTADTASDAKSSLHAPEEESTDNKRKQARPLTGKHVRPGTGASPATLLTLRRKIQARQQLLDSKRVME